MPFTVSILYPGLTRATANRNVKQRTPLGFTGKVGVQDFRQNRGEISARAYRNVRDLPAHVAAYKKDMECLEQHCLDEEEIARPYIDSWCFKNFLRAWSLFSACGLMDLVPTLAVMLGDNVGITLIVQMLAFNVSAAAPTLFVIGLIAFHRGRRAWVRDVDVRPSDSV